jgi:hypothetical protein
MPDHMSSCLRGSDGLAGMLHSARKSTQVPVLGDGGRTATRVMIGGLISEWPCHLLVRHFCNRSDLYG